MSESANLIKTSEDLSEKIEEAVNAIVKCLKNENKIIMLISYGLLSSVIGILFCYLGMNIIKWA